MYLFYFFPPIFSIILFIFHFFACNNIEGKRKIEWPSCLSQLHHCRLREHRSNCPESLGVWNAFGRLNGFCCRGRCVWFVPQRFVDVGRQARLRHAEAFPWGKASPSSQPGTFGSNVEQLDSHIQLKIACAFRSLSCWLIQILSKKMLFCDRQSKVITRKPERTHHHWKWRAPRSSIQAREKIKTKKNHHGNSYQKATQECSIAIVGQQCQDLFPMSSMPRRTPKGRFLVTLETHPPRKARVASLSHFGNNFFNQVMDSTWTNDQTMLTFLTFNSASMLHILCGLLPWNAHDKASFQHGSFEFQNPNLIHSDT